MTVVVATAPACCTPDDKCGLDLSALGLSSCAEMNAPGKADPACPSQSLLGFLTFEGCCREDNTCGAMDTFAGLGCVSSATDGAPAMKCGS
jgi:hypothetical protein